MTLKEFIRGQKIYRENESSIDGVYFITEGDFEVTQQVDFDKTAAH